MAMYAYSQEDVQQSPVLFTPIRLQQSVRLERGLSEV